MEENKTPRWRFDGFTDDWQKRKLGEAVDSFDEKRIPIESTQRTQGCYPYYGATGIIDYIDKYIFDGEYILLAEDGANIILRSSPLVYLTHGKFWVNNHAHVLKDKRNANSFLKVELENVNYEKYNSGTAQPKLNAKSIMQIDISSTSLTEENSIGNFFDLLDNLITVNQRKVDLLKKAKKALLQKIFDQTWRFAGFTDDWQKRTVSSLSEITSGGGTPKTSIREYWDGDLPWLQSSNLMQGNVLKVKFDKSITESAIKNSPAKLIPKGSIAVVTRVGVGKLALIDRQFATSQDFLSLSSLTGDPLFTLYLLYLKLNERTRTSQGTSIMGVTKSDLLCLTFFAPIDIREQSKVGHSLFTLDNLIAVNQRKVDLLKQAKKTLLQNMFI